MPRKGFKNITIKESIYNQLKDLNFPTIAGAIQHLLIFYHTYPRPKTTYADFRKHKGLTDFFHKKGSK